jgi:7-cyano-7-deazaguanine synthase
MCSISGYYNPSQLHSDGVWNWFHKIMYRATDRGRDSWGITELAKIDPFGSSSSFTQKEVGRYRGAASGTLKPTWCGIANCRAEPTTEYIADKRPEDIQPFEDSGYWVAHNGTIANDMDLRAKYGETPTPVDSAAIARVFAHFRVDLRMPGEILKALSKIKGSYALAIASEHQSDVLVLVTNYKPLYLQYQCLLSSWFFSSLPNYLLHNHEHPMNIRSGFQPVAIPPYSGVVLTSSGPVPFTLPKNSSSSPLVICSGGLDSVVAATWAQQIYGKCELLHFDYGCRATERELERISIIGEYLRVPTRVIQTDLFTKTIGGSPLTNTAKAEVNTSRSGEAGAEYAHEWVPARNLIMFAIATGVAEAQGHDVLVYGGNLEESGAFPDNEFEFVRKLNDVMPYAVGADKAMSIASPVGNLMKHEIVTMGLSIKAPLHLTWSCYEAGHVHCGTCGPDYMRKRAFKMNGVKDPAFKHEWNDPFWEGCTNYVEPVGTRETTPA